MKKKLLLGYLAFISFLGFSHAISFGQVFDTCVDISIIVAPPYSPYLSDWSSNPERILIQLTLRNSAEFRDVYLTWMISNEDSSIIIRTGGGYIPLPYRLSPDITRQLTELEVQDMFDIHSLAFEGTSSEEIRRTNRLPEGVYTICLHVYDYDTGENLCNPEDPINTCDCALCSNPFMIEFLDPPILTSPSLCPDTLDRTEVNALVFSWVTPGAPPGTIYTLELIELLPPDRDPEEAFLTWGDEPYLLNRQSEASFYDYRIDDPPLQAGHSYAWRVIAFDPSSSVAFRNEGLSEACSFACVAGGGVYGVPLLVSPANNAYFSFIGETSVDFRWTRPDDAPAGTHFALRIVDVIPIDRDPSEAINSADPFFQTTVDSAYFNFVLSDHPLTRLHRYAWRVTAVNDDEEIVFENDGHTEVRTFNYGATLAAPILAEPPSGNTEARPITLAWNGTPLPGGGTPQFHLKVVEIPAGGEMPIGLPEDEADLVLSRNLTASNFTIDRVLAGFSPGREYAWQVREYDSRPDTMFVFENGGNSEVRTFIVGRAFDEEGGDLALGMDYPGQGDRIADIAPPLISTVAGASGDYHAAVTIQEITGFRGTAIGEPVRHTAGVFIPAELHGILFLNHFGPGGDDPVPVMAERWESTPGSFYRWTLEIWRADDSPDTLRNWAEFVIAPLAQNLEPRDGQVVISPEDSLRFNLYLPELSNYGLYGDFRPGTAHSFEMQVLVKFDDPAMEHDTVYNQIISPFFHDGRTRYDTSFVMPRMEHDNYKWFVKTLYDSRVVASDSETFVYSGPAPCGSACVCPDAIYPAAGADEIPAVPHASFIIGFRPRINAGALRHSSIPVWTVRAGESPDQTTDRDPDFLAEFDMMIPRDEGPELSQFEVQLINADGDSLNLLPYTQYLWRIDAAYDPRGIRQDGEICLDSSSTVGPFGFTTGASSCDMDIDCVCIDAIYPANEAENIPAVEDTEFIIGLEPLVNPEALRESYIRIWNRNADETIVENMAHDPDFVAVFAGLSPREEGHRISIFEVPLVDADGDTFLLRDSTSYIWTAEVNFDQNSVRRDGHECDRSITRGGPFNFTTLSPRELVECNDMADDLIPQTDRAQIRDTLQIGGFQLILDRPFCSFDDHARITGRGRVINTDYGNWAVEFSNLVVNRENAVIEGRATAQVRDDIPRDITDSLRTRGGMSAYQVRRLNELWHFGGNILEAFVGDKKVPFGQNMDLGDIDNPVESGWALKVTFMAMTFEPTRAYFDMVAGIRVPITASGGEPSQWIGLYCQSIPFCVGADVHWLAALRLLDDFSLGSPDFDTWDVVVKHSPPRDLPYDYVMQPGDGTAVIISDRGFEQMHLEFDIGIPRDMLVPQRDSSGTWVDMGAGQTSFTGTFDVMRAGREMPDRGDAPADPLGGGFYLVGSLPMSRIVDFPMKLGSRDIVWDASEAWSPTPDGSETYSILGVPTVSSMPRLNPSWKGLFVREAEVFINGVGSTFGMKNFAWGSPLTFTAFAAPADVDVSLGDVMTVSLDTIDFAVDRGNIVRARIVTNTVFPGAKSGVIGIDLVYQRIPEDSLHNPASAILVNVRAREEEKFAITDYIAFTIARGSQMTASYMDPPREGSDRWGFQFDISGGLEMFSASGPDTTISIGGIEFEHFRFASDGHGLQAPTITFLGMPISHDSSDGGGGGGGEEHRDEGDKKVAGFPISLDNLGLSFGDGGRSMGLTADLNIALTGQDGGLEFGGGAGLALNGLLEMDEGRPQWNAPSLSLTAIRIDFESPSITIHGEIEFYEDDPTWGDGFGGEASVAMAKMFNASAELRFGSRDDFRYWFVKGDVTLNEATAIPIGPVGIYGFIGGAYQHMTPVVSRDGHEVRDITYEPTPDNTFGIMAGVHLGVLGSPSSFHAKVLLEAQFEDANLINMRLNGRGWFMCDLTEECNDPDDSWAEIDMSMDFVHDRFHAVLMANISLLPLLTINAPEGSVDILFEPGNWHVYIGRGPFSDPERNTVNARLLPDIIGVRAEGYCMIGNNISVNIGGINLVGGGFATGIRVDFHAGGTFLIFYGQIDGLFQAELAIIHLDEASRGCLAGAGGWYALASVNIFLGLEVGIDVDLWLISGRFEIFDAELGIDVLVGGPNPTFLDGDARGSFSILDGLVSGSFHYHFHLGDDVPRECIEAATDRFVMPEPIVSVSPGDGETNVSPFTSIGLGFALKEGVIASLPRTNQEPLNVRFRLQQPIRVQAPDGGLIAGMLRFSSDKLSAEWTTDEVFEDTTRYTVTAIAIGEVFRDGAWRETRRQTKTFSFRTGPRPRFIADPQLVDFRYPLDRERYSYVRGHENRNYIHLARNMNYLFEDLAEGQSLVAEYTDENREKRTLPLLYDPYDAGCDGYAYVENPGLSPNKRYHLRMIKRTNTRHGMRFDFGILPNLDRLGYNEITAPYLSRARGLTVSTREGLESFLTAGGTSLVTRREGNAQSRVTRNGAIVDTVLFDWYFRTGEYNAPSDKFAATTIAFDRRLLGENSSFVQFIITSPEPYDDDLSALVFLRAPRRAGNAGARTWLNYLERNDDLARDYDTLVDLIGRTDADIVRRFVLTTPQTRLRDLPGYIYFDATAPWQFNRTNLSRYRLADHEITFEQVQPVRNPLEIELPGFGIPGEFGGGFGGFGGFGGIPMPGPPDSYSETIITMPFNALGDLSRTAWRYANCLDRIARVRYVRGHRIEERVRDLISRESQTALLAVGRRTWTQVADGRYSLALLQKTISWQLQSTFLERWLSNQGHKVAEADRLEYISIFGDANHISFGEFSCGDPSNVPFRILSLEVR